VDDGMAIEISLRCSAVSVTAFVHIVKLLLRLRGVFAGPEGLCQKCQCEGGCQAQTNGIDEITLHRGRAKCRMVGAPPERDQPERPGVLRA